MSYAKSTPDEVAGVSIVLSGGHVIAATAPVGNLCCPAANPASFTAHNTPFTSDPHGFVAAPLANAVVRSGTPVDALNDTPTTLPLLLIPIASAPLFDGAIPVPKVMSERSGFQSTAVSVVAPTEPPAIVPASLMSLTIDSESPLSGGSPLSAPFRNIHAPPGPHVLGLQLGKLASIGSLAFPTTTPELLTAWGTKPGDPGRPVPKSVNV
jgi:hypothetical protein